MPARLRLPAALLLGLVASLAFAPHRLWPLAILAVAGLVHLLRPARARFALGWAFGFGLFASSLLWIARAFTFQSAMPEWLGVVASLGLAAFLALYLGLATALAQRLAGRSPAALVLALAGTVILAELLRGLLFTGFPWNPLGVVLLPVAGLRQAAAVIGAPGLSGLVVLLAGSLGLLLSHDSRRASLGPALAAAALAAPGLLPSAPVPAASGRPLLLLVQPNASQADKHAERGAERHLLRHVAATEAVLARLPAAERRRLAAVVWPEGAIEFPPDENPWIAALVTRALPPGALLVAGGIAVERSPSGEPLGVRNSLFVLDAKARIRHRYDKAHLVPGGEYLPLRPIAEPLGLARLVPGTLDFWPGPGPETVDVPPLPPFAAAICYEIIFPGAVVDRAERPEMILTVSSDAWFGPSGPPQHFDQARLRAIEEGLPVVRVTPTGITGVIDAKGRVLAALPPNQPGHLLLEAPRPHPPTPFARFGLAIPAALALLLGGAALRLRRQT
ncbi:apolipoprotein N-acyltransferase [Thermaurantiacus sp.]